MTNHSMWIHDRILSTQPTKLRMPLLCALNKSLAVPIFSEGWNEMTRGLNTHYYQLKENETYITSMAVSNGTTIAMGSGNPDGDLFFIKEDIIDKENEVSTSRFQEIHQTQLQRPIYSLDWFQQRLLAGSNHGIIQLYDTQLLDGTEEQKLELLGEYHSNHIPTSFWAPPQKCTLNSHVKSVSFEPTQIDQADNTQQQISRFLSTATSHVELWDIQHPGSNALRTMEPDQASLNFSQWSLLSPSLVVTGGQAGQLHVMDLRVQDRQPIVWQALEAHTGTILDGQFNPFIPYWLASAGGDGIVNIWDLRATCHKPLAKIDGHLGPVTSIAWGNVRPEKLATTSRDGTFRMWSLSESSVPIWESCSRKLDPVGTNHGTPAWLMETEGHQSLEEERWWPGSMVSETKGDDFGIMADDGLLENNRVELVGAFGIGEWGKMQIGPLYYGNSHKKSKGAVVKALVSKCRPGQFYCATSFGQLCSQIFRPTSRGLLDYPHRFDYKKDPLYYTIDNAIHYRHIKVAEKFIDKLKSLPIEDEEQNRLRNDHVKDFENCLQLRPSIKPAEWEINCIPRHDSRRLWTETDKWQCALDTFRKDLAYWRCRIAPGCVTIFDGIPFDTGERHPRLCSEMMQGVIPGTDSILSSPPSPPTQLQPSSISTSRTNMDQLSIPKTKQSLRRSSTTPNMTSDDLLTPYEDLKSMNERNSSGTLLNTCINWKPLQRSKTTTPINHRDSRSSPLSSPTTTTPIKLQQQKDKSNADDDNEDRSIHGFDNTAYTSPTEMDFKSIIKYGSFGKQPLTTNSADDGIDDQPSRDHTVGTISPPAITKRSSTSDDIHDTEHDNLHSQVSNVNDTSRASPQAMDLKSIIKYGSFKQPPLDNKNQTGNEHDITRSSSHSSINHQINMDLTNNNIPTSRPDQSLLSSTMSSNSGDAVRPNLRRQPSSILAPAKSLGRAFTKKLKRKKTSASSSSPITPSDKDPENYRQQPQLDTSRPSPRNAL